MPPIVSMGTDLPARFPERELLDHVHLSLPHGETNVRTNGRLATLADHVTATFASSGAVHEIRVPLPRTISDGTGTLATFRLSGWQDIRYAAIGWSEGNQFRHVMIPHPLQDRWTTFAYDTTDLIARLQNRWANLPSGPISDVRVYVKGSAGAKAGRIDVHEVGAWKASPSMRRSATGTPVHTEAVLGALRDYLTRKNEHLETQVTAFLENGSFPVTGTTLLPWPVTSRRPAGIDANPTFRYIWHSLYPAAYLILHSQATKQPEAAESAHRIVDQWMTESFFSVDDDQRYAWYDHGTAERTVALVLIRDDAVRRRADARYRARLDAALEQHAMLLESEAFYAANQVSRFHNHAWFQDLALLAAGATVASPAAERWTTTAAERLHRQVAELICIDGDHAVFVENSIGYHHGIQSLVEFAHTMLDLTADDRGLAPVVQGLDRFSRELRYDDGRAPSQGDTFRIPNVVGGRPRRENRARSFTHLPHAGYTSIRGDDGHHLMFFATSLSTTHKHCDNLSLTLYLGGVEWLIDPSFHSHEYTAPVPGYLRGPWAHNALVVRDARYAITPGTAVHRALMTNEQYEIQGEHTAILEHRVQRRVTGRVDRLELSVEDTVTALAHSTAADVVLHLGEGVSTDHVSAGLIRLTHPSTSIALLLEHNGLEAEVVHGWSADDDRRCSVAGTSFGEHVDTASVLLAVPADGTARWSLSREN